MLKKPRKVVIQTPDALQQTARSRLCATLLDRDRCDTGEQYSKDQDNVMSTTVSDMEFFANDHTQRKGFSRSFALSAEHQPSKA